MHWTTAHKAACKGLAAKLRSAMAARAAAGEAGATTSLGIAVMAGIGAPADPAKAAALFERAAAAGDADAVFNLYVVASQAGRRAEAVRLLERAAAAGHAQALHNLSSAHAAGDGVPRDDARAVELLKRAAEAGCADSLCNMGNRARDGRGVSRDATAALSFYRRAADSGGDRDGRAAYAAASLLLGAEGRRVAIISPEMVAGLPLPLADPQLALKYAEAAAACGSHEASYMAAMMHMVGVGVGKSPKWIPLMRRAAKEGNTGARGFLRNNRLELRDDDDTTAWPL
jgi:TPR repeat protein